MALEWVRIYDSSSNKTTFIRTREILCVEVYSMGPATRIDFIGKDLKWTLTGPKEAVSETIRALELDLPIKS